MQPAWCSLSGDEHHRENPWRMCWKWWRTSEKWLSKRCSGCVYSWAVCDGGWACETNLTTWLPEPGDSEATGRWSVGAEHVFLAPLPWTCTALPCVCHGVRALGRLQQSICSAAHPDTHSLTVLCSQRHALNYPKQSNAWYRLKIPDIWTCQKFCISCGWGFGNYWRGYQNLLLP